MVILASPKTLGHSPKGEVRGDDDRGALVEATDEVEQQLAAGLGEGQIAEFVEDKEVEAAKQVGGAALAIGASFCVELVDQVDRVEEAASLATPDAGSGDPDGEMGFTGSGAADQYDVALLLEEVATGELANQGLVDRVDHRARTDGATMVNPRRRTRLSPSPGAAW